MFSNEHKQQDYATRIVYARLIKSIVVTTNEYETLYSCTREKNMNLVIVVKIERKIVTFRRDIERERLAGNRLIPNAMQTDIEKRASRYGIIVSTV